MVMCALSHRPDPLHRPRLGYYAGMPNPMKPTTCPECGQPDGECYNLCPNSPAYYSPEQERHDDAFYGDDDIRERYAAEAADMRLEDDDYDGEAV